MKKIVLPFWAVFLLANTAKAQNVGINYNGNSPDNSAGLDVDFNDKGVLIPRVNITDLNSISPITGGSAESLLIYNTNTITGKGFYYWDGSKWVSISGNSTNSWDINGNGGLTGSNKLGTTDSRAVNLTTNNTTRFIISNSQPQIQANGNGSVSSPSYSWSSVTNMGMFKSASNSIGFSTGGIERFRIPNTNQVYAMSLGTAALPFYSWYSDPNTGMWSPGSDILGFSTAGAERMRILPNGRVGINTNLTAYDAILQVEGNFGFSTGNLSTAYIRNNNPSGTGLISVGQNGIWNTLIIGSGASFTADSYASYYYYSTPGVGAGSIIQDAYGAQWNLGYWSGSGYYKIIGNGIVSTIVKDLNDEYVVMACPESPEVLFMDYGTGVLVNGKAYIYIDPILSKNIIVNKKHPLKVFIQLEGECNGVYVSDKTANGFHVTELGGGVSNTPFSWSIVATRGNETVTSPDGKSRETRYDGRFEKAMDYLQSAEATKTK